MRLVYVVIFLHWYKYKAAVVVDHFGKMWMSKLLKFRRFGFNNFSKPIIRVLSVEKGFKPIPLQLTI